jgi:hypothetical protein
MDRSNIIIELDLEDTHLIFFNDYQEFGLILIKHDQHQAYNFRKENDLWYLEDAFDVENNFQTVGYLLDPHPLSEGWILTKGHEHLRKYISLLENENITLYTFLINTGEL